MRWEKISHKEQPLLLSYWNTRRINDVIFHVESDLNYLQNSHQDSQPGMCFFSFLFSFPSLTLKTVAVAPSHMDSAAPFPHVQDTLGPEPVCPALAGPVPLLSLHSIPGSVSASPAPAEEWLKLMSLAWGNHLPPLVVFVFLEPFSPGCLLLLQHQQH